MVHGLERCLIANVSIGYVEKKAFEGKKEVKKKKRVKKKSYDRTPF